MPLRDPRDERQLDFRTSSIDATGLLTCADVTVVSAVDGAGNPHARAANIDGVALATAEDRKADKYPELAVANPYGVLTVLAMEVAGRWSGTCVITLRALVRCRVQRDPPVLRRAAALAWTRRWSGFVAIALQRAVAVSLLDTVPPLADNPYHEAEVFLADLLTEAAHSQAVAESRLPLH